MASGQSEYMPGWASAWKLVSEGPRGLCTSSPEILGVPQCTHCQGCGGAIRLQALPLDLPLSWRGRKDGGGRGQEHGWGGRGEKGKRQLRGHGEAASGKQTGGYI